MLLVDDLLLLPVRSLLSVFREVYKATQQEYANESEAIRATLSELYMMLETGQISEADFDARERGLLDRLDELETRGTDVGNTSETDD